MANQNTPENEGQSEYQKRIAADRANMSPEELRRLEGRRGVFRAIGAGAAAIGLGSLVGGEADAEEDAVERAMKAERSSEAGKDATVEDRVQRAKEKKESGDRAYAEKNPSVLEKGRDKLLSEFLLSHDVYRDGLVPVLTKLLKELAVLRTTTNAQLHMVDTEADAMIEDKAVKGRDTIDEAGTIEWIDDVEIRANQVLSFRSKAATGVSDFLVAANALEGLIHRAPHNVRAGRWGVLIENIGVNLPVIIALVKMNWDQYIKGETKRVDSSTSDRTKQVKERAKTRAAQARRAPADQLTEDELLQQRAEQEVAAQQQQADQEHATRQATEARERELGYRGENPDDVNRRHNDGLNELEREWERLAGSQPSKPPETESSAEDEASRGGSLPDELL